MRVLVVCAVLAATLPSGVGAQTFSLTEAQALARLSAESPRVQAVRAAVDIARADVLGAGRLPNPRVIFNREAVAGIAEHMLMVSQVLPVTGRRRLDVSAASARVDAATSRADDEIRRLRADLRLSFTDLWAAQARERELTRSRDRLRDLAEVAGPPGSGRRGGRIRPTSGRPRGDRRRGRPRDRSHRAGASPGEARELLSGGTRWGCRSRDDPAAAGDAAVA